MASLYGRTGLARRLPPIFNTVITNVPGPNMPLYSMGSRMVANYGLGPIVHGVGLFQPVIGYNGQITISAISCREMMPDPAFYCDCLSESFDDLRKATKVKNVRRAQTNGAGTTTRKAAAKKKKRRRTATITSKRSAQK